MEALIDADSLVYRTGFAAEATLFKVGNDSYTCTVHHIKEAKKLCDEMGWPYEIIEKEIVPEPVENCLHSVKITIQKILQATGTTDYKLFLSGGETFRHRLATIKEYKVSRNNIRRPHHYEALREYLIGRHGAIVADDEEADDMVGYNGYNNPDFIMCHLDKDINMIPGKHYNWDRDDLYEIDELTGMRWFYHQLITGDTSDDIVGLSEERPKRRTYKTAPIQTMMTEKEMYDYVFEGYALKYCDDAAKYLLENGQLLYIRREPNQLWRLPY